MRRVLLGLIVAVVMSAGIAAADQAPAPKPDTVVVPWCEIWPWDPLCWFLPVIGEPVTSWEHEQTFNPF